MLSVAKQIKQIDENIADNAEKESEMEITTSE